MSPPDDSTAVIVGPPLPLPKEPAGPVYRLPFRFGRYTLLKRLGVGGMAEAFLAHTAGPAGYQKKSVVKRMLPHLAEDARYVQLFQREAKVAALLTHTNVVQIYELGEIEGIHFIAMEHVDGAPLHQLARTAWRQGKSVPMEVVCCAMADTALGLAAAHALKDDDGNSLGVVHRDISPDNLMMNREGITKILDFGIAKHKSSHERTATGELKGKLPFMPPEQLEGKPLDGRADLYSLGVTFYWLVTGRRPFTAVGEMSLMDAICKERPAAPSTLNPMIPSFINDLIMTLLEKDRDRRVQTGAELYDLLADAVQARRSVVVPFVQELLAAPGEDECATAVTPSFAASPHSAAVRAAWQRRAEESAPVPVVAPPAALEAPPSSWPSSSSKRLELPFAAALAAMIAGAVVIGSSEGPPDSPVAARAPVVPRSSRPVAVPPAEPVVPIGPVGPVVPEAISVQARAPASVQWVADDGSVLGVGNATVEVPAETKHLVAVDKKRGGRSRVPIKGNIADYGALPHAKIHPRANPYAEVFLGNENLGTTPFAPVDVVIGRYNLRFIKGTNEQRRTVELHAGEIARVIVDFSGK